MNIGFEAKRIFTNFTGLGNYGRFVVSSLADRFVENSHVLYTPRTSSNPEVSALLSRSNVTTVKPHGYLSIGPLSSVWRTWAIGSEPSVKKLDVFHGLSQELPLNLPPNLKRVVTVHDLIFLRYPKLYNPIDVTIYTAKVKKACERADLIIAISEQTAADVRELLSISGDKIRVVYQGCQDIFFQRVDQKTIGQVRAKYKLPEKYILSIGTIEERKNLIVAIKALHQVPEKERIPLVVVGRKTRYQKVLDDLIEKLGLGRWVSFIHEAAFSDLPALYQAAHLFVYPSIFEGFGIPLVEAIASQTPVLTSKGSCFIEAAGPSAAYADPKNAEELAYHMMRITGNSKVRDDMIKDGSAYITRFSPSRIAEDMMAAYREIL